MVTNLEGLVSFANELANESENKDELLRKVISAYDKAASKGIIHKRNAARNVSRISKLS